MEVMKFYCLDNSERAEYDALDRGYRGDVFVHIHGDYFALNVYEIVRLSQDFATEIDYYGFYASDPNLILVEEVKLSVIELTVQHLYRQKYFDKIKPLSAYELQNLELKEYVSFFQ